MDFCFPLQELGKESRTGFDPFPIPVHMFDPRDDCQFDLFDSIVLEILFQALHPGHPVGPVRGFSDIFRIQSPYGNLYRDFPYCIQIQVFVKDVPEIPYAPEIIRLEIEEWDGPAPRWIRLSPCQGGPAGTDW